MNIYDDAIASASQTYGIDPGVLKGLLHQESAFDPDVISGKRVSSAGAIGIAQFMPATAKQEGIDPTDPIQSIFGAAAYLKKQVDKFGSVSKGLAAYNWGEGNLGKAIAKKGDDWTSGLPPETSDYITKIAGKSLGYQEEFNSRKPKPESPEALAQSVGVTPAEKNPEQSIFRRVGDIGVDLAKGAVGLGEAAVGLVDLPTFGYAGKGLAAVGFDPKDTKKFLEQGYSDARQKSESELDAATGVMDTAKALLTNPGMLIGKIAESAPSLVGVMGAAGKAYNVAKAAGMTEAMALSRAKLVAAAGEGAMTSGQIAETARQENPNDVAAMYYALPAGVATALISSVVGKLPGGSMETMLAGKGGAAVAGNAAARVAKGVATEGLLEEGGQSLSEQAFTNLATNKPIDEGLGKAFASGVVIGGAQGGAMALMHPSAKPDAILKSKSIDDALAIADTNKTPVTTGSQQYDPSAPPIDMNAQLAAVISRAPTENADVNIGAASEAIMPQTAQPADTLTNANIEPVGGIAAPAVTIPAGTIAATETPTGTPQVIEAATGEPVRTEVSRQAFQDVSQVSKAAFIRDAVAEGVDQQTAERLAEKRGSAATDNVTGFFDGQTGGTKADTVKRAQAHVRETNEPAFYVDADIANLGGLNNFVKNDAEKANVHYRAIANIMRNELRKTGGDVVPMRTGGDEIGAVVVNADAASIGQARERIQSKIAEYTKVNNLSDIPHPKGKAAGVGLHLGVSEILPTKSLSDTFSEASRDVDRSKNEPREQRRPIRVDGAIAGTAGEAIARVGQTSREGDTGSASQASPALGGQEKVNSNVDELLRAKTPRTLAIANGFATLVSQGVTSQVDLDARQAAASPANELTPPTQKQIDAGNFKVARTEVAGMPVAIEFPRGSTRTGTSPNGNKWSRKMEAHYGRLTGTKASDGMPIDVYLGPTADNATKVFVVDQVKSDRSYDEAKVMIGYKTAQSARDAYMLHYPKGWKGVGGITEMPMAKFREWVKTDAAAQPLSEAVRSRLPKASQANADEVVIGSYGVMPSKNNQPLTLKKNGSEYTLFQGKDEAIDGDTGEPVTYKSVAEGVADVKAEMTRESRRFLSTRQKAFIDAEFKGESNEGKAGKPSAAKSESDEVVASTVVPLDAGKRKNSNFDRKTAYEGATPEQIDNIAGLGSEIGWAETGGRLIRDADGNASSRTNWVANSPFWPGRPDTISAKDAKQAIRLLKAGEPMSKQQKRFIDYSQEYLQRDAEINAKAEIDYQKELDSQALEGVQGAENLDADSLTAALDIADQIGNSDLGGRAVSNEEFLRAMGATEEEINDAKREDESARGRAESPASAENGSAADRAGSSAEQSQTKKQGSDNRAREIWNASRGGAKGLGLAVERALLKRDATAIKTPNEALKLQADGKLDQISDRKGYCFGLAAEASADGLGDYVIGKTGDGTGGEIWHAVVQRNGFTYDPTLRAWFAPGVYETLGFDARKTMTGDEVIDYLSVHDDQNPDAQNLGLDDGSILSNQSAEDLTQSQTKAADKARQAADDKRVADNARDSFALDGGPSGRVAPENNANNQQGLRFNKATEKDLIVQHNLTVENLYNANRMGGLAVPSLAITKSTMPIDGFGEISLLGPVEMADPKGYAKSKVYGADIYSPRYPEISYKVEGAALKKINQELTPYRKDGAREIYGGEIKSVEDLTQNDAFRKMMLEKTGKTDIWDISFRAMQPEAERMLLDAGAQEQLFKGFNNDGNRKYSPHTLESVVKILKKELRGGEGTNYGVGSIRAKYTPEFKTLKQIKDNKGRLVSKDDFAMVKDEVDQNLMTFADSIAPYYKYDSNRFGFLGTVTLVLEDAGKVGFSQALADNQFVGVSQDVIQQGANFLQKLKQLPAEYFEAKILRSVDLAEFKVAVVPADLPQKARDILAGRGLKLVEYDQSKNGARAEAIDAAAIDNDLRFNKSDSQTKNEATYEPESDTDGALAKLIADVERQSGTKIDRAAVERVRMPNDVALQKIAGAFGNKIVGFTDPDNVLGVNGATFPDGNTIWLDAGGQRPHLAVLFHELGHQLEAKNPALYAKLEAAIREQVDQGKYPKFAAQYNGMSASDVRGEFTSEFLADAAMTDSLDRFWTAFRKSNRSAFEKVVDFLRQMVETIRKVAYTNETREYMKDFDAVLATAGEVMGDFAATKYELAQAEKAKFNKADISKAEQTPNLPDETFMQKLQRVVQEKDVRFKVVQDWLQKAGVKLSEMADVYTAMKLYPGRVSVRKEDFRELTFKPIVKELEKAGFSLEDAGTVLHAQHAQERNEQIARVNPKMQDGGSGMKTADAKAILANAKPELLAIANKIRAISDDSLNLQLSSGLIDQEAYDRLKATYSAYVPLKGGDETVQSGAGKGFDVKSKMKRAMGHTFRDEKIIENILHDHEMAIVLSEKNRVAQTMLQFALETNDPGLVTIDQPVKRAIMGKGMSLFEVRYDGQIMAAYETAQDARAAMLDMMAQAKQVGSKKWSVAKVSEDSVRYQASPMLAENEVGVYLSGQFVRMQINDPLTAQSYKNLGVDHINGVLKVGRSVNTWLSKAYTGYNPAFIPKNMVRDFTEGVINLTGDYGVGMMGKIVAKYPKSFVSLVRYAATGKATPMISDYRADGSTTGAAYMSDMDRVGEEVRQVYNDYAGVTDTFKRQGSFAATKVVGDKTISALTHFIEVANAAAENAMRLATYEALRENGYSRSKSALAAKDVTLNFNRKGEIGAQAGALYLFFNPSVQGSARLVQTMLYSEHKEQAWALTGAMAVLFYAMAAANDDADKERWEQTPDFDKAHNLIIPAGKYQVKIPIPYGYGFFGSMGTAIYEAQHGKDLKKVGYMMANAFAESFSPVGNPVGDKPDTRNLPQVLPTTMKIPMEIVVNRTGLGGPVYPERKAEGKPDSSNMFRNTKGTMWDSIATTMNEATGGNKAVAGWVDVSPDTIKSLFRTATGGTGTFITDTAQLANLTARGADADLREIPFARDFVREPKVGDARRQFWDSAKEAEIAQTEFSVAKKNLEEMMRGKNEDAQKEARETLTEVIEKNRALLGLGSAIKKFSDADTAKRNSIDAIMADTSTPLQERRMKVKEIELAEKELYSSFIQIFKDKEQQKKSDELARARGGKVN